MLPIIEQIRETNSDEYTIIKTSGHRDITMGNGCDWQSHDQLTIARFTYYPFNGADLSSLITLHADDLRRERSKLRRRDPINSGVL